MTEEKAPLAFLALGVASNSGHQLGISWFCLERRENSLGLLALGVATRASAGFALSSIEESISKESIGIPPKNEMKFLIVFALVAAATAQLSNEYLPPHAESSYSVAASAPAPEIAYAAPSYSAESYDVGAASEPAHSYSSDEGYRYKTQRRRVYRHRHRRDVSTEYLPPVAAYSAPAASYAAPAASYSAPDASYSAPAASYSAPAASYSAPAAASYETYDVSASAPAHSYSSDDGYRYKTQRRRVYKTARRHRRDVSTEYLPPVASYSAPAASYSAPAASYSAPAASYSAPAVSYSAPAAASYSAPAVSYSAPAAAVSYSAPAAASYSAPAASYETYDVSASAPAHSYSSDDGYRYKTQRRRVFRTSRRHRF
ncbi:uncharacterized protein LOC106093917 [Stomoxys calcitrans]|uniref:uncharacterized protein LOC106093917 n=1 Tax=Stomoxys calcitrans TaxID=35570 RepID=UPI0027E22DA9|nr:uncharacterized protein LOC106093917 [Stomoxys calcitrans]